jgi:hypothetical protein
MKEDEMIREASQLWAFLQKKGGLDIKRYDTAIVEELREKLTLPSGKNFNQLLVSENVSAEDLIIAFFQVVQPYAKMMSDILKMFEMAGAKRTDNGLYINFDFGKNLPQLNFDLSHFRDWIETWKKIASTYIANIWDIELLWDLNKAFRVDNKEASNQLLYKWIFEYSEMKRWPDFSLNAPESGLPELDKIISKAWKVWRKVVKESLKYGKERDKLKEIAFKHRRNYLNEENERPQEDRPDRYLNQINSRERRDNYTDREDMYQVEDWPPSLLWQLDSELWAGSFAKRVYAIAEEISTLAGSEKKQKADQLSERLDEVFLKLPKVEFKGESLIRELEEFLNLPIWKKRHELYSVWICTQIVNAFENLSLRIHQVDETLTFSFSGTHFASIDAFLPHLHIWAELRSPLLNPIGKGRTKAIQPDYSLITDPVTNPKSSVLEVECKQYLKASRRKFADALTDYAKGRPNAHVVLVNYGKASETILNDVDKEVKERTIIIGEMKPDSKKAQIKFKQTIQNSVEKRFGYFNIKTTENVILNKPGLITLTWENEPRDLDLHLKIFSSGNPFEIYYSSKGSLNEKPWVRLDNDVTSGYGPENIEITNWSGDMYHCAVYNFSKNPQLADCNARVIFKCGDDFFEFECPDKGNGFWWDIFIIDAKSGEIKTINKIVDSPW